MFSRSNTFKTPISASPLAPPPDTAIPTPDSEPWAGAVEGTARRIGPGCKVSVSVRGDRLAVVGHLVDGAVVEVFIDGTSRGLVGDAPLVEWAVAEGWHDVELVGLEGDGFLLDYVEATGPGVTLDELDLGDRAAPGAGCACNGVGDPAAGGRVVVALAALAWVARPRRSPPGAPVVQPGARPRGHPVR